MRPISTSCPGGCPPACLSGSLFGKQLYEPLGCRRELRALAGPMLDALEIHAQRLAARRGLRVVEAEPLKELALHRTSRIGHHHVIEGPLVGAAARQSNHYHWESPST